MNERIKELLMKVPRLNDMYEVGPVQQAAIEDFAKLIILECTGVVEGGNFLHEQAPTAIFARECSSTIKRHFGTSD